MGGICDITIPSGVTYVHDGSIATPPKTVQDCKINHSPFACKIQQMNDIEKVASEFLQEFYRIQTQYIIFETAIDKTLAINFLRISKPVFQFVTYFEL